MASEGVIDADGKYRPTQIVLDLIDVPIAGSVQTIIRTKVDDKKDVNRAANALNMTQSDFVRLAVLGVARKVLAEVEAKGQSTFQSNEDGTEAPSAG